VKLRSAVVLMVVLTAQALPTISAAGAATVPPGVSGANQYAETLPGPDGNRPTNEGQKESPEQALGKKKAAQLERLGPEGKAAAELAAETASGPDQEGRGKQPSGGHGAGALSSSRPSGSSGFGQVLGQVTGTSDGGGMGLLLPLLVGASVVLAGAYALTRRRAPGHQRD
jgi:hypothetical protein